MSHTFQSVREFFGERAELVGGVITVYENGKHTDIGRIDNTTGVFTLTADGVAMLDGAPAPKSTRKKAEPAAE